MTVAVRDADGHVVTPDAVVWAYWQRMFPMADHRRGRIRWYRPHERAIISWDRYVVPRSLAKVIRNRRPYRITANHAFPEVIAACADRESTWINRDIERLYVALHDMGVAHSVEAWDADGALVGGCYGLALGGCFAGESMFTRADDAAKICVAYLVARLQQGGFRMLDCQQQTPHMERFGCRIVADAEYALMLEACRLTCSFGPPGDLSVPC